MPVLIIHGSEDDVVDPNQAEIFEKIHVPMVRVIVMDKCRHFPFMDAPETFNRFLIDFLMENEFTPTG